MYMRLYGKVLAAIFVLAMAGHANAGFMIEEGGAAPGNPSSVVGMPGGSSVDPSVKEWVVSPVDGTVHKALERWAQEAGWNGVEWKVKEFDVQFAASFTGTLEDAIDQLMRTITASGTPVRAEIYENGVIRVVPRSNTNEPQE